MELIEITDEAIVKLLEKQEKENFKYIRLGITGRWVPTLSIFLIVFVTTMMMISLSTLVSFQFVVDKVSVPYINGMTLD